jgi:hypothetical protein
MNEIQHTISIQQAIIKGKDTELYALKFQNDMLANSNEILRKYIGFEKYELGDSILNELANNEFIVNLLNQFKYYNFERMKICNEENMEIYCGFKTYGNFIDWNKKQFSKMPNEKKKFLLQLSDKISNGTIKIGSNKYFILWKACTVYINKDDKICINHPR